MHQFWLVCMYPCYVSVACTCTSLPDTQSDDNTRTGAEIRTLRDGRHAFHRHRKMVVGEWPAKQMRSSDQTVCLHVLTMIIEVEDWVGLRVVIRGDMSKSWMVKSNHRLAHSPSSPHEMDIFFEERFGIGDSAELKHAGARMHPHAPTRFHTHPHTPTHRHKHQKEQQYV